MYEAHNFTDHKYIEEHPEVLKDHGLAISQKVMLKKRITVAYGPDKVRKDVYPGVATYIKGVDEKTKKPCCEFKCTINGEEYTTEVIVNPANLTEYAAPAEDGEADKAAEPQDVGRMVASIGIASDDVSFLLSNFMKKIVAATVLLQCVSPFVDQIHFNTVFLTVSH